MIETSNEIKHISAALLKFQGLVGGVGKSSANPHFKSRYANLETVVDTARPELQAVGIVFMQSGGAIVDGVMAMTTRLTHADSGEWIQGTMDICLGKRDPQGVGSAQTYAQRYHLMAMLGLPPVDDDGEGAIDRNNTRPEPVATVPKAKARSVDAEMRKEIDACTSVEELKRLWNSKAFQDEYQRHPQDWQDLLVEHFNEAIRLVTVNPPRIDPKGQFDRMEKETA
jgi:hypothetical protein